MLCVALHIRLVEVAPSVYVRLPDAKLPLNPRTSAKPAVTTEKEFDPENQVSRADESLRVEIWIEGVLSVGSRVSGPDVARGPVLLGWDRT